ncbi:MAG: 4Fe-4S cluster-binding domain-containing protein [Campylobacteraceae bacterium]
MLYLVESFLSIQGEGKYAGTPSVFFRFGGCNFTCKGFDTEFETKDGEKLAGCDSFFAVDVKNFKDSWDAYENSQKLFEKLLFFTKDLNYLPDLVITGGEPLLHHTNEVFFGFVKKALKHGFRVCVETNASIVMDFEKYEIYKNLIFAMSVKLSNSGEKKEKRVNLKAIETICKNAKEAFFKFVVRKKMIEKGQAKEEISEITSSFKNVQVYCMALGKDRFELLENDKSVIDFCIQNGYIYTDRVHIRVWDNKKGV